VPAKPYLRFHVDEVRLEGKDWQIPFTPRVITWEAKQTRLVPEAEMRRIWKAERVPVALDEVSIKKFWKQIENGVKDYLIREYWSLDEKK
jgi:hypothetical protein